MNITEKELINLLHIAYVKGYDVRGERAAGIPTGGFKWWISEDGEGLGISKEDIEEWKKIKDKEYFDKYGL